MIIQDDEFITQEHAENLKNYLISASPWHFNRATNVESANGEAFNGLGQTFQFVSGIEQGHPLLLPIHELFRTFASKHEIEFKEIIRVKANLLTRGNSSEYHSVHIDQDFEHKVFLYYVNDSDGDTVFFNEFWSQDNPSTLETLTEQVRVAPKMGRGVVFDGLQYHTSTSPINNEIRVVVNIDFI
jgi:hypothetical protein